MTKIFLVGMPGSGKSTLARALCEAGLCHTLDLDTLVETTARRTIPAIMRHCGEDAFRRCEADALQHVISACVCSDDSDELPLVISTGGGTPCHGNNMDAMLRAGTVVWLQAEPERILSRIADAPGQRPAADAAMAAGRLAEWHDALLAERTPHYSRAHTTFDTSKLDNPSEIAAAVERWRSLMHI